jgi:parallel beta-helix repeat protein
MNEGKTVIRIAVCTHVVIANFTIRGAGAPSPHEMEPSGIFLFNSSNTVIANVTIVDNWYAGMSLRQSNYNLIENSLIIGNNYGIWIGVDSLDNAIIHNNFINNNVSCIIYSSNTVFYNYWDNYKGEDANCDGVGDTPYQGHGFQDECPLIEQWMLTKLTREFSVGTHTVTIRSDSMISAFNYNQTSKEISFNIIGPSNPSSLTFFCEVNVPRALLSTSQEKWRVLLNGTEVPANVSIMEDYTLINFTGHLGKFEVQIQVVIITDFGFYVLIATFTVLIIVAVIMFAKLKRRLKKTRKTLP